MAEKIALVEYYLNPVSLSCKHSFCSSCLQKFWERAGYKNCPICKRKSSKDDPLVNFTLKELADSFTRRQKCRSSETEKGRALCPGCEFSLHQSHKVIPVEQAVSELKEQLRSDLKYLQDKRNTHKQVEKTYENVIQHSKKQLLTTERQIRAEFNKLHQFLKEESRLAALREEEEQKGKTISREMIQDQISSLSDKICRKTTCLRSLSDPQAGLRSSDRFWEKMKEKIHFSPVILDPNTAYGWLHLSDDLTSVRYEDAKYANVFGSEGFSSGKHSWEVEVGDHPGWNEGYVKESVKRKGDTSATPKDGIWCVLYPDGEYTNDMSHIYTHRDTFTEKLFPFLGVCPAANAKTSEFKICQTETPFPRMKPASGDTMDQD
uniref:RING-type domain-containing protein n=1 Tax=Fundulus heteroclitus TaxID=8078 RepID=A0A3Q2PSD8_FUNHE